MTADDDVVIGRIGRPHGIGGEMRANPTGPTLGTVRPREILRLIVDGVPRDAAVTAVRSVAGGVLLRLDGVTTREEAALLTGAEIAVDRVRLRPLTEPDEFYVRDLIGCVVNVGEQPMGPVVDVYAGSANDALVVQTDDGQVLVPFTHDAVVALDLQGRRVTVRPDLFGAGDP